MLTLAMVDQPMDIHLPQIRSVGSLPGIFQTGTLGKKKKKEILKKKKDPFWVAEFIHVMKKYRCVGVLGAIFSYHVNP